MRPVPRTRPQGARAAAAHRRPLAELHVIVPTGPAVPKTRNLSIKTWISNCYGELATMAKKAKRRTKRVSWTKSHLAELRKYSRDKLPVKNISRLMKRSVGALRQKARHLGIRIGHRR